MPHELDARKTRSAAARSATMIACALMVTAAHARADVLTQRSDVGRTGSTEDSALTPDAVSDGSWGKLRELPVDGAVFAQPLFVSNLSLPNGNVRDVVFIATNRNKLYAFETTSWTSIWPTPPALPSPDLSDNDLRVDGAPAGCALGSPTRLDVVNEYGVGIQSTPVIDRAAGYLYFTYREGRRNPANTRWDAALARQHVARVRLTTGQLDLDVDITGAFGAQNQPLSGLRQRASLLLQARDGVPGVLYAGFGMHCEELSERQRLVAHDNSMRDNELFDTYKFRGLVLAIDQKTLRVVGSLSTVPAAEIGGGVWQASSGLAADDQGRIYFSTGNAGTRSTLQPGDGNLSSAIVMVQPQVAKGADGAASAVTFPTPDWFMPRRALWQNRIDLDLGSAGVLVPPGKSWVIGGGKEGVLYVLDRAQLGHVVSDYWGAPGRPAPACIDALPPVEIAGHFSARCDALTAACYDEDDEAEASVRQKLVVARNMDCAGPAMNDWRGWAHIHGTPAFGKVRSGAELASYMYLSAEKSQLTAWKMNETDLPIETATPIVARAAAPNDPGMPGGMLTLVQNPGGSGVLLAAMPLEPIGVSLRGALIAFDAAPQSGTLRQLWADYQEVYYHAKFVPPTVGNGRVFLATHSNKVLVYGRRANAPAPVASAMSPVSALFYRRPDLSQAPSVLSAHVAPDGRLAVYGEENNGVWHRIATLGAEGELVSGGAVVVTQQAGTQYDILAVGSDGQLHGFAATNPLAGSWFTFKVPGLAPLSARAGIASLERSSGSQRELDVFAVDVNGDIEVLSTVQTGPWRASKLVSSAGAKFTQTAGLSAALLTAANRTSAHVFAVDTAQRLVRYGADAAPGASWSESTIAGVTLVSGAQLASGTRSDGTRDVLHVFAIGGTSSVIEPDDLGTDATFNARAPRTGSLVSVSSADGASWEVRSLKRHKTPAGVPGGALVAINQGSRAQLDVIFASQLGTLMAYAVAGSTWTHATLPLFAQPGAPITAVAHNRNADGSPSQVDVLAPAPAHIYLTSVSGTLGAWLGPLQAL